MAQNSKMFSISSFTKKKKKSMLILALGKTGIEKYYEK